MSTCVGEVHRVLLAPDRDRADGVDDLELVARLTMNAASFSNFQGGCVLWLISAMRLRARDAVPVLFLVDDDRVGREAEQADDLGMVGRAEQHDRVALVDELRRAPSAPGSPRCTCRR